MMWTGLLGIGAANMSLHASIDAAANYAPLVQSEEMVKPLGSGVLAADVADALFMSQVCVLDNRAYDTSRHSVVWGRGVSDRVSMGCPRAHNKQKKQQTES